VEIGNITTKTVLVFREIATLTYRSGVEWEQRFGRTRLPNEPPSLCHNFEIEQYIEYQGLQYATKLDANTLLYVSKVRNLFNDLQKKLQNLASPKEEDVYLVITHHNINKCRFKKSTNLCNGK